MTNRRMGKPERMPGSQPESSAGMADYLIVLKDSEEGEGEGSRSAFYHSGVARNAAFQERLRKYLRAKGVADQVAVFGEPTVFPLVALHSTPEVAKLVRELPDVEDVVRDVEGISLHTNRNSL
jgi:hypothetical protein